MSTSLARDIEAGLTADAHALPDSVRARLDDWLRALGWRFPAAEWHPLSLAGRAEFERSLTDPRAVGVLPGFDAAYWRAEGSCLRFVPR